MVEFVQIAQSRPVGFRPPGVSRLGVKSGKGFDVGQFATCPIEWQLDV
jgi:hypothetical protein